MKKLIIIALMAMPFMSMAYSPETAEYVALRAKNAGINPSVAVSVGICESDLNNQAYNANDPNGGSRGIFQFQKPTWDKFTNMMGYPELGYRNFDDQISVFLWALLHGFKDSWSCMPKGVETSLVTQ